MSVWKFKKAVTIVENNTFQNIYNSIKNKKRKGHSTNLQL